MKEAGLKLGVFEPIIPLKYKVTDHPIEDGTIIEKIIELANKLKADEQLLVFYPGVAEVLKTVEIIKSKFHRTVIAITGNQSHKVQENNLAEGQIFISTAIAETSLTFRKLRFVIDSRRSRGRVFDP